MIVDILNKGGYLVQEHLSDPIDWEFETSNSIQSGGCLKKSTYADWYYKLSSFSEVDGFYGHESINEYIAYQVGKKLGFNVVETELEFIDVNIKRIMYTTTASRSRNYKPNGWSRVSLDNYYAAPYKENETVLDFCRRVLPSEYLDFLFAFDYLIINRDRHGTKYRDFRKRE